MLAVGAILAHQALYKLVMAEQFSIDRIDNKIAHIQSNCQITCWNCNLYKH